MAGNKSLEAAKTKALDTGWREEPRFAALRDVVEWLDEASARHVYASIEETRRNLALAISNPGAFRAVIREVDVPTLSEVFSLLDLLVSEFENHRAPLTMVLGPWIMLLRNMASAEGVRRGLILARGENPQEEAFATCIAMTLGFEGGNADRA